MGDGKRNNHWTGDLSDLEKARRYNDSPKGQERYRRYRQSPKYLAKERDRQKSPASKAVRRDRLQRRKEQCQH